MQEKHTSSLFPKWGDHNANAKSTEKNEDKEQGKTHIETPCSENHKVTQKVHRLRTVSSINYWGRVGGGGGGRVKENLHLLMSEINITCDVVATKKNDISDDSDYLV